MAVSIPGPPVIRIVLLPREAAQAKWPADRKPTVVESQCYQVRDPLDLAVFAAAIATACIGFLWWNAKPAQIIMGDVGSLAIGGALAGLAIMSRTELLMAVIAGLFVLETLSVLLAKVVLGTFAWPAAHTVLEGLPEKASEAAVPLRRRKAS